MPETQHDVRRDYVGFNGNLPRLTCYSEGCDEATIVAEPWMMGVARAWEEKKNEFFRKHPCSQIKDIEDKSER